MEKKLIKQASGFITESSAATKHYTNTYGIDQDRIIDVRCVPDLERLQKIKANVGSQSYPNEFVITYAGNFTAQRDLHTLIKAVAEFNDTSPSVRLLMIGDGPVFDDLVDLTEQLGISDRVEFTGWISFERMFDYLAASDVGTCLCLPESKDSSTAKPNKLFQYMFMGLPVIVGNLRAMRQTITKAQSGIVVEPNDVDDLVSAIRRLYENNDLVHELGQNGKQAVLEEMHFQRDGKSILELYRTVLD